MGNKYLRHQRNLYKRNRRTKTKTNLVLAVLTAVKGLIIQIINQQSLNYPEKNNNDLLSNIYDLKEKLKYE